VDELTYDKTVDELIEENARLRDALTDDGSVSAPESMRQLAQLLDDDEVLFPWSEWLRERADMFDEVLGRVRGEEQ
jgi:SHS2 domain-containing protein